MVCGASLYRASAAVQRPYPKPPDINMDDMFLNKKRESQLFVCVYYNLDGTVQMIKLDFDGFYFGEWYAIRYNTLQCLLIFSKHTFCLLLCKEALFPTQVKITFS